MPTRNEFKNISNTRLKEVKVLYRNGLYDGAVYLSGYVIETALKARICKLLDLDYPEIGTVSRSYLTHKFDDLVKLAGLQNQLDNERNTNFNFNTNWSLINNWSETIRYKTIGTSTQVDVEDIINALQDPNDGILTWIKKRW
jgi:hypothetical protein